jgi:hypothetical protein
MSQRLRCSSQNIDLDGVRNPVEEDMVNRYTSDVIERMKKYWSYKVAELLTRMVSHFLYKAGLQDYWDEKL